MSENCVFSPPQDIFRTFFRDIFSTIFSDIVSTFPLSGLSNDLPVTNINKFAGLSRDWVGAKILFTCLFFHILWGRKTHKQSLPQNPGTIPWKFCLRVFFFMIFFSRSRSQRNFRIVVRFHVWNLQLSCSLAAWLDGNGGLAAWPFCQVLSTRHQHGEHSWQCWHCTNLGPLRCTVSHAKSRKLARAALWNQTSAFVSRHSFLVS